MALTPQEKQRQRDLEAAGNTGVENDELHNLNVQEDEDKSSEELMRIVGVKEGIHGAGWAKKARGELRRRGYLY